MSVKYTPGLHSALLQTSVKVKYESQKRTQKCYVGGGSGCVLGFGLICLFVFVCFGGFVWMKLVEVLLQC